MDKAKPKPSHQTSEPPQRSASSKAYFKYTNLALQIVLSLGIAGGAGYWADQRLSLKFPILMLTFILLAFIGIMYRLIKTLNQP